MSPDPDGLREGILYFASKLSTHGLATVIADLTDRYDVLTYKPTRARAAIDPETERLRAIAAELAGMQSPRRRRLASKPAGNVVLLEAWRRART